MVGVLGLERSAIRNSVLTVLTDRSLFDLLQEDPNLRLLGPRDFSLDRLLAIFSAIADRVGDIDTGNHNIYHQVRVRIGVKRASQLHHAHPLA
jgi:hypothetical protein